MSVGSLFLTFPEAHADRPADHAVIDAGYLLPEDLERILAQSARRWDLLASAPESAAAQ
jgi:hypothetical protein